MTASDANLLEYTPVASIPGIVDEAREASNSRMAHSYEFRMTQLRGLQRLVEDNADALSAAIAKDLGQGPIYAEAFELNLAVGHARHAQSNLRGWMATRRKPTPFPVNLNIPVHSELSPNPRGVALILTPWNLPVQMSLNPLVNALAAGNVCVLKMSERSVHCTRLLTQLLTSGEYVDRRAVRVINGGADAATALLAQRWDAIMYTGGGKVGRIVAEAAAKNLTPVLLELGGKNPAFVTRNADIKSAAMRLAWGKISGNAGQMCICPDYVLVEEAVKEEFVAELCSYMDQMYPVSSYASRDGGRGDVGRMISVEHARRVVGLVDFTSKTIYGGKHHDVEDRFVAPTIVEAATDSTVMKEEIFGPILAIVTKPNLDSAIGFVNQHYTSKQEHPLVLYIFSRSKDEQRRIMESVPSGTCGINEVLKQSANYHMPFGGVGASGMNAYYGKSGFDFFSHYRGTLAGSNFSTWKWDPSVWMVHPPYTPNKLRAFRLVSKVPVLLGRIRAIVPFAKVALPIGFLLACGVSNNLMDAVLELNLKTVLRWLSPKI
ncbi:hypothetical protein ACHAXT_009064 [Thalassiosira profunda]